MDVQDFIANDGLLALKVKTNLNRDCILAHPPIQKLFGILQQKFWFLRCANFEYGMNFLIHIVSGV